MESETKTYSAVVRGVYRGRHGPYFVVEHTTLGPVTISLDAPMWQEVGKPTPGTYIVFWDVRRKKAGWRAERARFFRPEDTEEK